MDERNRIKLADLEALGIDIQTIRRVKRDANAALKLFPLERDAHSVPLILPKTASRVVENFRLPFSTIQDNSSDRESAAATMFIRMNAEAYFNGVQDVATSELSYYLPSKTQGGFLQHLDTWIKDSRNFDMTAMTSGYIGAALMLQLVRTQLGVEGAEFVANLNKVRPGFDMPSIGEVTSQEWVSSFSKLLSQGINHGNLVERLSIPVIPREQTAIHDVLEMTAPVVPVKRAMEVGAIGVYHVLDQNWGKLKLTR